MLFLKRLKKLYTYMKYIWNEDTDWDYESIFELLKIKLTFMEKSLRSGYAEEGEKNADEIKEAIATLDRIINCSYDDCDLAHFYEKWGQQIREMKKNDNGLLEYTCRFENTKSKDEDTEASKELFQIHEEADKLYNKDIKYLFEFIGKNIQKWWD